MSDLISSEFHPVFPLMASKGGGVDLGVHADEPDGRRVS